MESLPPKYEHVLYLRPSPVQAILYNHAIEQVKSGSGTSSAGPLKAFAMCSKVGMYAFEEGGTSYFGVALFELLVWPHEVEPWFHSWYRGRVETLDAK